MHGYREPEAATRAPSVPLPLGRFAWVLGWCAWMSAWCVSEAPAAGAVAAPGPVALAPIEVAEPLASMRLPLERLAAALERALAQDGYRVIAPRETGPAWSAAVDSLGGLYDTSTGELDTAKLRAARRAFMARMSERSGAAAALRPRLEIAEAEWRGGKAEWDGVAEGIGSVPGGGIVPALTLVVEVLGPDGAVRCEDRGGVQVLMKYGLSGKSKPVEPGKLLADDKRVARAAALALECATGKVVEP